MLRPQILSIARAIMMASLTSVALVACKPKSAPPPAFPPSEVSVITVAPRTIPVTFEYVGQTTGSREVEVRARVTGIILKRAYSEGSSIKTGQLLFDIDQAPFRAALARADADVASAEARLLQAKQNANRLKPLYAARAVSQKDFEDATSAELIAVADLKAAKARLTEARLNLSYTKIQSPVTGVAGRALRSEGNFISGPDVLLTTVTQVDPIYANFGISSNEQLRIKRELDNKTLVFPKDNKFDVKVKFSDGQEYAKVGKLNFTDPRISSATGTSDSRAELPNPDGTVRPGQFIKVLLSGATRPSAIALPQRAVLEGPTGKFVYLVNSESKVEIRPIQVGEWTGDIWIINSGLKAGDKVIVDGVMKIGPGAPVKVNESKANNKTSLLETGIAQKLSRNLLLDIDK